MKIVNLAYLKVRWDILLRYIRAEFIKITLKVEKFKCYLLHISI